MTAAALRSLDFVSLLSVWPYRALGPPTDENDALIYAHKLRLTAAGLTVKERETSRKFLQRLGYYEWLTPFKEKPTNERSKASAPRAHRRNRQ